MLSIFEMKKKSTYILIINVLDDLLAEEKLMTPLLRSDTSRIVTKEIFTAISSRFYKSVSTKKIYCWAFSLLPERSNHFVGYHLKRRIMQLGPSYFSFEKFIGKILRYQEYGIKVREIIKGQCVNHGINVIAKKSEYPFMVESNYDVKILLYIEARFKDVEAVWLKLPKHAIKFHQCWVVKNIRAQLCQDLILKNE